MWSGFLNRQELQMINIRFEARPWLMWKPESLKRLDFDELNRIKKMSPGGSWDYALSWLLENNRPSKVHEIVLFNRQPEDEPPLEAIKMHPWMEPLKHYPLPRKSVAEMVDFLHKAGARLIILDNDFPQYSDDDKVLAAAIHNAANDKSMHGGNGPTPVLFVRTINRRTTDRLLFASEPTTPYGVLDELKKLEPGVDVMAKYTALPSSIQDEDQVVRRFLVRYQTKDKSKPIDSLATKAAGELELPGKGAPIIPDIVDIDFSSPPNSSMYPVRPLTYLLDPKIKDSLLNPLKDRNDVTVRGSVVIIGDSIVDVFSTPLTNLGVEQMSGSEIIAHSIDTLARRSWPTRLDGSRLDGPLSMLYAIATTFASAVIWIAFKLFKRGTSAAESCSRADNTSDTSFLVQIKHLGIDFIVLGGIMTLSVLVACAAFVYNGTLVPLVVPALSIAAGGLAAALWEREKANEEATKTKLAAAQEKYETDLKRQEAEATAREILADQHRRKEFVRRINHDLNAPVSVMNWTLVEMHDAEIESAEVKEKVELLTKNSDRLCELIDQLVQSYDYSEPGSNGNGTHHAVPENMHQEKLEKLEKLEMNSILRDCVSLQKPLAELRKSNLELVAPEATVFVTADKLALTRILDNLVRNALKHNGEGTTVTLSMKSNSDKCTVSIADNGKGIPPEHLDKIFDSGYRVDPSSSGQGLGLNIVKELVEKLKGNIDVRSECGKGTTFEITLTATEFQPIIQQKSRNKKTGEMPV